MFTLKKYRYLDIILIIFLYTYIKMMYTCKKTYMIFVLFIYNIFIETFLQRFVSGDKIVNLLWSNTR